MENQEILHIIAELAVAIVGFSGIVAALGRKRTWNAVEIRNLATMLRAGFSAMFLSLLPIGINLLGQPDFVWRISLTILATVMFTNLAIYIVRSRNAKQTISQKLMFPMGAVVLLASTLGAIGVIGPASSVYIMALLWMLIVSSHNFVLLLTRNLVGDGQ